MQHLNSVIVLGWVQTQEKMGAQNPSALKCYLRANLTLKSVIATHYQDL